MGTDRGAVLRRRGLIWVSVGDRPTDRTRKPNRSERQRTKPCPGMCGVKIRPGNAICWDCRVSLAHVPPLVSPGRPVCACGCLLTWAEYASEDCPACKFALLGVAS